MKKRTALHSAFIVLGVILSFQVSGNPDSLRAALSNAQTDRERMDILVDLGMEMVGHNLDSARAIAMRAIALSERTDKHKLYEAHRLKLIVGYYRGDYPDAIESGLIIRRLIDESDSTMLSAAYNNLGLMYMSDEAFDLSEMYYDSALLWLPEGEAGLQGKIDLYTNLGILDERRGDLHGAIERSYQALELFDPKTSPENAASIYQNICNYSLSANDLALATKYGWMALRLKEEHGIQHTLANTLSVLGHVHLQGGNLDSAEFYFLATLNTESSMGNPNGEGKALHSLAGIYLEKSDLDRALDYVQQAESVKFDHGTEREYLNSKFLRANILNEMGRAGEAAELLAEVEAGLDTAEISPLLRELYREISSVSEALGDYPRAMDYERKAFEINEKILDEERVRSMVEMEARYEGKLKDAEIEALEAQTALAAADLKKQRLFLFLAIGGSLVFASMLVLVYRQMRQRKRLHIQEKLALERERELASLRSMIAGEENERSRVSKELHDGLSAHLASIKMKLGLVRHKSEALKSDVEFNRAVTSLDEACGEVRRIAHDMSPRVLEQFGLVEGLKEFLNGMDGTNGVKMYFEYTGGEARIGKRTERAIYRIVQELINNTVKHSKASEVFVLLTIKNDKLTLRVEDNGRGFDVDNPDVSGLGLSNLASRVGLLGGELNIEARPERGTSVFVEILLKKEVEA